MGTTKDNTTKSEKPISIKELRQADTFIRPTRKYSLSSVTPKVKHSIFSSKVQLLIFAVLLYAHVNHFNYFAHPTNPLISDLRMAIFGMSLVLTYLCYIFLPETSKGRGAWFWKLVQAVTFTYAMNALFWLFLSKENLQYFLENVVDERLGKPLPERDYATHCEFYTPDHPTSYFGHFTANIDMFASAHFVGWMFKVWIMRNHTLAWVMSIGFEMMEYSFEVFLPNFKECWWDHWLLDVFGCNLIGMIIGFYTIRKFNMRRLFWFMAPSEKMDKMTLWQQTKYLFTSREEYIREDKWHWLAEPWTFNAIIWYMVLNMGTDLSYFFVKSQIDMPPPHWVFAIRIWVLGFFTILVSNDYYDYVVDRKCNSMTLPIFLHHVILIVEWLMFFKNMKRNILLTTANLFDPSFYPEVKAFWAAFFLLVVGGLLLLLFHSI